MSKAKLNKVIDLYAGLAIQRAEIDRQLKTLRPEIVALGDGEHAGKEHLLLVTSVTTQSLSTSLVKAVLTPAEIAECTVASDSTRITVER